MGVGKAVWLDNSEARQISRASGMRTRVKRGDAPASPTRSRTLAVVRVRDKDMAVPLRVERANTVLREMHGVACDPRRRLAFAVVDTKTL